MESLGKYIEALLQENDCVVLPSFGAFIARTTPARYVDNEHTFIPPSRSLGFNQELTSDDGLLTSFLMQRREGVSFSAAKEVIDAYIDRLRDTLAIDGAVRLPGIGRLRQDIVGHIQFEPVSVSVEASSLFGLDALSVYDLPALEKARQESPAPITRPTKIITATEHTIDIHFGRHALRKVATVAAVLLLLIVFAVPVNDGQHVDIASLGILSEVNEVDPSSDSCNASPTTNEVEEPDAAILISPSGEDSKPEVDAPAIKTGATNKRIYHVIIGSLPSQKGADAVVQKYIDKGFEQTTTVVGDEHVRISIASFTDKAEGEAYVQTLRQDEAFKHAWLLSVKAR